MRYAACRVRRSARHCVSAVLDRIVDQRRRAVLPNLQRKTHARPLPVIISARMLDLHFWVRAGYLDLVITFFHVRRKIAERKLSV